MKARRIVVMSGQEYLTTNRDGMPDWTLRSVRALEYSQIDTARHDAERFGGCAVREFVTAAESPGRARPIGE